MAEIDEKVCNVGSNGKSGSGGRRTLECKELSLESSEVPWGERKKGITHISCEFCWQRLWYITNCTSTCSAASFECNGNTLQIVQYFCYFPASIS